MKDFHCILSHGKFLKALCLPCFVHRLSDLLQTAVLAHDRSDYALLLLAEALRNGAVGGHAVEFIVLVVVVVVLVVVFMLCLSAGSAVV